jgi:hypothetical protein
MSEDRDFLMKMERPVRYGMGMEYHDYACPSCGQYICPEPAKENYESIMKFCYVCGQALDWSD